MFRCEPLHFPISINYKIMNIVIWDIESSSSSTDFGSIIEIGGILVDQVLVQTLEVLLK